MVRSIKLGLVLLSFVSGLSFATEPKTDLTLTSGTRVLVLDVAESDEYRISFKSKDDQDLATHVLGKKKLSDCCSLMFFTTPSLAQFDNGDVLVAYAEGISVYSEKGELLFRKKLLVNGRANGFQEILRLPNGVLVLPQFVYMEEELLNENGEIDTSLVKYKPEFTYLYFVSSDSKPQVYYSLGTSVEDLGDGKIAVSDPSQANAGGIVEILSVSQGKYEVLCKVPLGAPKVCPEKTIPEITKP